MHLLTEYHLWIGIAADVLTFGGGLLLARDAFSHLKDLRERRINEEFRRVFPNLPLADEEETAATSAGNWAAQGLVILAFGFIFQILSRIGEPG